MPSVRRTSMNLDFELVDQARAELGEDGTTETVHAALRDVVRRARIERLLAVRFEEYKDADAFGRARAERWGE